MNQTRTHKSLKNGKVALVYSVIGIIVTFFFRKAFIDVLGAELLGLNTTATNLLQFLNLTELGIGGAITFTLYKPLYDKDINTINEIVSIHGWLYRRIACIIIGASLILMCFFPLIFEKSTLPLWYAYTTFSGLLFNALLGYFINYPQIVLTANQENYKVYYVTRTSLILKLAFQYFAILYLQNGYLWWLTLEIVSAIVSSVVLKKATLSAFEGLSPSIKLGAMVRKNHPQIITKTKQLFVHKIAGFVLTQTQPLIIYAFASLAFVGYYGNYLVIISGLTLLVTSVFNGTGASVGNLVSQGEKSRIIRVFEELYCVRFLIVSILSIVSYYLTPQFIDIWLGKEYILDNQILLLIIISFYIMGIRSTVDNFIQAYGLFHDLWAPATEAVLNMCLSILLGYLWGVNGVLLGSIISLVIMVLCWKPYLLFKQGFKITVLKYLKMHIILLVNLLFTCYLTIFLEIDFSWEFGRNIYLNFIINSFIAVTSVTIMMSILLYLTNRVMRIFIRRMLKKYLLWIYQ